MNRSFLALSLLASLALGAPVLTGCAVASEEETAGESEEALTVGQNTAVAKVDGRTASVRVASLTLTVDDRVQVVSGPSGVTATVKLRSSRDLESVMSFVPDDAFGTARLTGPRTIEVDLAGDHELNSILSGLPLFLGIATKTGTVSRYEARVDLAARFFDFEGDSRVWIDPTIRPVLVRDGAQNLRYRGVASAVNPRAVSLDVSTDDDAEPVITSLSPGRFQFDWQYPLFQIVFDNPRDPVLFNTRLADGRLMSKRAHAELEVTTVGLTRLAAYDVWPSPTCSSKAAACVLAAGTKPDLGHCGAYREVSACLRPR